jgi:uncharacterized protein YodC (DUF2158 family)
MVLRIRRLKVRILPGALGFKGVDQCLGRGACGMAATVKFGDIVELCSGGPAMTVGKDFVNLKGHVVCYWFVGDEMREKDVPVAALKVVSGQ